jgi:hypothetical protein
MKDWQKLCLRAVGGAAGVTVALVGVGLSIYWYSSLPRAWDTHALIVRHAKAEADEVHTSGGDWFAQHAPNAEVRQRGIFTVDVENTTRADVSLPKTLTVMGQTKTTHALHESFLKLTQEYFLPARHVTTIVLYVDDLCEFRVGSESFTGDNQPPQSCFDRNFKGDEATVIFDEAQKYEILIPVPPLTLPCGRAKASPETPAPPCKNGAANCEPWQRDWGTGDLKPGSVVTKQGLSSNPVDGEIGGGAKALHEAALLTIRGKMF